MINGFRQETLLTESLSTSQTGDVVKGFANSDPSSPTPSFVALFDSLDSSASTQQLSDEELALIDTPETEVSSEIASNEELLANENIESMEAEPVDVDNLVGLGLEESGLNEVNASEISTSETSSSESIQGLVDDLFAEAVASQNEIDPELTLDGEHISGQEIDSEVLTQAELSAELATAAVESVIPTVQVSDSRQVNAPQTLSSVSSTAEMKVAAATLASTATAQVTTPLTTQAPIAPTAAMMKFADMGMSRETAITAANDALQTLTQNVRSEQSAVTFKATVDKQMTAQQMGQQLSNMIADKVSVQVNAKTPIATIRLDPPDLGKIDLVVKVDNDKLHVQINASSQATRESIQQTSDRLRNELMNQNFINVEVSIADGQGENRYTPDVDIEEEFIFNNESQIGFDDNGEGMNLESELARA